MEIRALAPFAYDSVKLGPAVPLAAIAKASGASVDQIVKLNPQILRGMTPPRDSVRVRIPLGAAVSFDSLFRALTIQIDCPHYGVRPGVFGIGRSRLLQFRNGFLRSTFAQMATRRVVECFPGRGATHTPC